MGNGRPSQPGSPPDDGLRGSVPRRRPPSSARLVSVRVWGFLRWVDAVQGTIRRGYRRGRRLLREGDDVDADEGCRAGAGEERVVFSAKLQGELRPRLVCRSVAGDPGRQPSPVRRRKSGSDDAEILAALHRICGTANAAQRTLAMTAEADNSTAAPGRRSTERDHLGTIESQRPVPPCLHLAVGSTHLEPGLNSTHAANPNPAPTCTFATTSSAHSSTRTPTTIATMSSASPTGASPGSGTLARVAAAPRCCPSTISPPTRRFRAI
jgi:hypothetical protein